MKNCKVYKDGMHFIAMRPTVGISGPRNKPPPEEPIEVIEEQPPLSSDLESDKEAAAQGSETKQSELSSDEEAYDDVCPDLVEIEQPPTKRISTRADEFIRWYRESVGMRREKRREFIASKLFPYFPTEESLYSYIDRKMDTRYRSDIARRIRCLRRAALHELSYFCTVTYFYGHCFQGGKNFAPLPALLRFMVSKGAFTIIFAPNSVNLRGVRVQGF